MFDRDALDSMPTAIGRLIVCRCGHGIGSHGPTGCRSETFSACRCTQDAAAILESAIDVAARELAAAMPTQARRPAQLQPRLARNAPSRVSSSEGSQSEP